MDQQISPEKKSPEWGSGSRLVMVFAFCTALFPVSWHGPGENGRADAAENQHLAQVRMNLDSETFLDPLPFDTPFLMTGQAPASVQRIEIRVTELLEIMAAYGDKPESMEAFRKEVRSMLSSLPGSGASRTGGDGDIAWIQNHLAALLIQSGRDRWPDPGSIGDILPWNWGNWGKRFEPSVWQVIAPETIFDPDATSGASIALLKARLDGIAAAETETKRQQALDMLVDEIVSEAKTARIAKVRSGSFLSPLRWQRVPGSDVSSPDSTAALSPPSLIWNRLENRIRPAGSRADEPSEFAVLCPPLRANRQYLIDVRCERNSEKTDPSGKQTDAERKKNGEGNGVIHRMLYSDTEADNSISADAGLLYAGTIHTATPYLGINYYFRPLNRDVPLRAKGGFLRQFSLTCGLTLKGIDDAAGTRENLFQSHALVTGAGYRLTQHIRAAGGWLVFREHDPQTFPLSGATRLAVTPYLGLSFDADVWRYMKEMGKMIESREDR